MDVLGQVQGDTGLDPVLARLRARLPEGAFQSAITTLIGWGFVEWKAGKLRLTAEGQLSAEAYCWRLISEVRNAQEAERLREIAEMLP